MIIATTISGKGARNWEGTNKIHGNPMKPEDYKFSYESLGLKPFEIDPEAESISKKRIEENLKTYMVWKNTFEEWSNENKTKANELNKILKNDTTDAERILDQMEFPEKDATRSLSGNVLNAIANLYPALIGGSADLAGSNNTTINDSAFIQKGKRAERNIHFGVREHAMGGIMNGISYHGVLRPYGGTFLVFSDYMRPSVRLAALSNLPTVYIWTHDSFYVGEDGPTHHPVEHISALRAIPNLNIIRPADSSEVVEAWRYIIKSNSEPIGLCLTRQKLDLIDRKKFSSASLLNKGAYILKDSKSSPELIVIASGSEVSLALSAIESLDFSDNIRLVSMPSMFLFEQQDEAYKETVLPKSVRKRFFVEAASSQSFFKYIGIDGDFLAKDDFSKSAPYQDLEKDFGFNKENLRNRLALYYQK
jgi:transketolase